MTTSLITAGGYKMLARSIALAMVVFVPANLAGPLPVPKGGSTAIYWNPAPIVWDSPQIRPRSPGPEVWDAPTDLGMASVVIPRSKPEMPKPNVPRCRKGEKVWRTLANGHRKYRLRRTC